MYTDTKRMDGVTPKVNIHSSSTRREMEGTEIDTAALPEVEINVQWISSAPMHGRLVKDLKWLGLCLA